MIPLALVTGAAQRVGRGVALELARQGFAIGLHYHRSRAAAEQAAAEIEAAGVPVFLLPGDLADPAQVSGLFERVAALPHPLRVLVNSAAVMPRADLREMPVEDWDATLNLNLRAPWLCARAAARLMTGAAAPATAAPDAPTPGASSESSAGGATSAGGPASAAGGPASAAGGPASAAGGPTSAAGGPTSAAGGGVIINITDSGAGKVWTGYPAYVVSKAALETLTRLLARALAPAVRVNAVAPGLILPSADLPPEQWQRLVDRLPLRAAGQPEDVARAVLFFIQNPYVTGQVLAVDGGYQLI